MKDDKRNDRQGVALSDAEEQAILCCITDYECEPPVEPNTRILAGLRSILSRASSSRAEVERDAARWRHCEDICHGLSDERGEFFVVSLPRPENLPPLKSTADVFRYVIDADMFAAAEAPNGETGDA